MPKTTAVNDRGYPKLYVNLLCDENRGATPGAFHIVSKI